MQNSEEKYFVCSNGEEPDRIHFNWEDAVNENAIYIDSFDEHGQKVTAYKLVQVDGEYLDYTYTEAF